MRIQFTLGYFPDFEQISRILLHIYENPSMKVTKTDIAKVIGLSNVHTSSLINIAGGFGLLETKPVNLTPLGKAIVENDLYFESISSNWIIHYIISSNPENVVWYRIVNQIIPMNETINVSKVSLPYFQDLSEQFSVNTMTKRLRTEISAVLQAYTRGPLSNLHIINQNEVGNYVRNFPVEITPLPFLYIIMHYKHTYSPSSTALTFEEISLSTNSPGIVLNLPKYKVRSLLNRLHDNGLIRLERFGDLDQLRFPDGLTKEKVLGKIYNE